MATDPDPSLFSLLHDDSKTLITLGTAILGVTATFGKTLLAPNGSASVWLLVAWIAIAGSVVVAIVGSATVFSRLKEGKTAGGSASLCMNAAFVLLVIGLVTLASVAYSEWNGSPGTSKSHSMATASQSMATAKRGVAAARGTTLAHLQVSNFSRLDSSQAAITVADRAANASYVVIVDTATNQIVDMNSIQSRREEPRPWRVPPQVLPVG